jgi:hypothetical protein
MLRPVCIALLVGAALTAQVDAQEPEPIGKALNCGTLTESFTLVSGLMASDGQKWRFTLKLQAKKDVDTAELYCLAGFFDRNKQLLYASPLMFQAGFPLKSGECVNAYFVYEGVVPQDGVPWQTIQIRPAKKPN